MTVFSQLAVAVSSGNWFSWWEEVQFSGCYKYHQCLQSPAMLLWQKLLKVFSLNSKSFGQPWQDSENIKSLLMFLRNNLGKASPTSALVGVQAFGKDELQLMGVTQGSCGPHYVLPPSPASLLLLLQLCDCCFCAEGRGGEQEHLRRFLRQIQRSGSAHTVCLPLLWACGLSGVGGQALASCQCELWLQVLSVSELCFLMLWNIYTINF